MLKKFLLSAISGTLVLCFSQDTTAVEKKGVMKFKMTNDKLPIPVDFIRITDKSDYSDKTGYGWTSGERVSWKKLNSGYYWAPNVIMTGTFPDIITGSWVAPGRALTDNNRNAANVTFEFKGEIEFKIDLPGGDYYIYMILGDYYYSQNYIDYLKIPYMVSINDKKGIDIKISSKEAEDLFYRHEFDDYNPHLSYWERYVKPRFERTSHLFKAVSDGSLRIKVKDMPVDMIAVWPETDKALGEAWLKDLDTLRAESCECRLKDFEKEKLTKASFSPSPEQEKTGYVVFANDNWMNEIYPYTRPEQNAISSDFKLFAAPGEIEPVTFGIYPLKDIEKVKIEVTDLLDAQQNNIPASNVDVRIVKYMEFPQLDTGVHSVKGATDIGFIVKPWILSGKKTMTLYKDITRECWLRINVPENAKPGIYEGKVFITSSDNGNESRKLMLKVLPFKLKSLSELDKYVDLTISYIYPPHPKQFPGLDKGNTVLIKDWLSYGFNIAPLSFAAFNPYLKTKNIEEAKGITDFKELEECVKDWKSAGPIKGFFITNFLKGTAARLMGNITLPRYRPANEIKEFPKGFDEVYTELALLINNRFKKEGWPDIIFDEGGEGGGYAEGRYIETYMHRLLHKAGVKNKLALSGTFEYLKEIAPLVWSPDDYYFNQEHYEWMKTNNINIFYAAGNNRFERGLYFWRIDAKGHHNEGYCAFGGDPYNYFDSPWSDYGIIYPSRDGSGINPAIPSEHMREGHDDARYLFHLQSLIKESEGNQNDSVVKARESANKLMEKLKKTIDPDLEKLRKIGYPSNDVYEKIRWSVAKEIEKLDVALTGSKNNKQSREQ